MPTASKNTRGRAGRAALSAALETYLAEWKPSLSDADRADNEVVPRGSRVPLRDYDTALLDVSQQRVADDWVAAVLARAPRLEFFDGVPRR